MNPLMHSHFATRTQRIYIGAQEESPAKLNQIDSQKMTRLPFWSARVARLGSYRFTLEFAPADHDHNAYVRFGTTQASQAVRAGDSTCVFESVALSKGDGRLEVWLKLGLKSQMVEFLIAELR